MYSTTQIVSEFLHPTHLCPTGSPPNLSPVAQVCRVGESLMNSTTQYCMCILHSVVSVFSRPTHVCPGSLDVQGTSV